MNTINLGYKTLVKFLGLCVIYLLLTSSPVFAQRYGVEDAKPANTNIRYIPLEYSQKKGVQQVGEAKAESLHLSLKLTVSPASNLVTKANQLFSDENYQQALDLYNQAIKLDPKFINAYLGVSHSLVEMGNFDSAIKFIEDTTPKFPNNNTLKLELGMTLYRSGNITKAVSLYKEVIAKEKDIAVAHFNLAIAYAHQEHFQEAIEEYLIAIKQSKNYSEAYNNLGLIYEVQGNLPLAKENFDLAIKSKSGNYPLARYNLARLYFNQGDHLQANNQLNLAIKEQNNFPEAYLELGNIYLLRSILDRTDELASAISSYQKAILLRSNFYPLAHNNLAVALSLQGNKQLALDHYQIAFDQYEGKTTETLANLINTLLDEKDFSITNELSQPDNIGNLRKTAISNNNITERLTFLLKEYENIDDDIKNSWQIHYCVISAYLNIGKQSSAMLEYEKALKLISKDDSVTKEKFNKLLKINN